MSIYDILASKPHNPHYLNRYINFVESCQQKNVDYCGPVENHHICPKADDMFPEYIDFSSHPWNKAPLIPRQHLIAHQILSKAFPDIYSIVYSYWAMSHMKGEKINSRLYESIKVKIRKLQSELTKERILEGNHPFCGEDGKTLNQIRIENGTHHWLGPESNRKRLEDGTHNFLGGRNVGAMMIRDGTHPCFSEESRKRVSEFQLKRSAEGTHHFLGGEIPRLNIPRINRERVESGIHQFLGTVACVDRYGNINLISITEYENNFKSNGVDCEFVHVSSLEGKGRLGKERVKLGPIASEHKKKLSQSAKERLSDPKKNPNYGKRRKLISLGSETRMVELRQVDQYLSMGWQIGFTQDSKRDRNPENRGSSKQIMYDGKVYKSIKACMDETGLKRAAIRKAATVL